MTYNALKEIEQAKLALEKSIKLISEVAEPDESKEYLEKYTELVDAVFKSESYIKAHQNAYYMARTAQTIEEYDTMYSQAKSQIQTDFKETPAYKEMIQNGQNYFTIAAGGDIGTTNTVVDDDVTVEENIPTLDPLTKGPLINPVKNSVCGHIYEKSTMEQAIKEGQRMRCPTMGCNNPQWVQLQHLLEDKHLKIKLIALMKKTQQDASDEEMDED